MKYNIIISAEAENDLMDAFSWYENIRIGLGHDFLLQIESGLRFIKSKYSRGDRHFIIEFFIRIRNNSKTNREVRVNSLFRFLRVKESYIFPGRRLTLP